MKIFPVIILLFLSLNSKAQTNQKLTLLGVLNENNPVRNAHCFLKNYNYVGTVTDSLGYFHMDLNPSFLKDTLVLSAIGYDQMEIPLSSIDLEEDTIRFFLKQKAIILNEVLVESKSDYLEKIFLNAFASIPDNYARKTHQLRGLYRKVSTEGTKYTHLEEAVITLEDKGYNAPNAPVKIRTEAFKESKEFGNVDSFKVKVSNKMQKALSEKFNLSINPIYRLLIGNWLRYSKKKNSFFNYQRIKKLMNDHYTLDLMDISVSDGDTIYQIAFQANVIPPPPKHASGRNYIKINSKDWAIVEWQITTGFENKPIMDLIHLKYQKVNGEYYLQYVKEITPRSINRIYMGDNEYDIYTFSVDEVITNGFKKIKSKEITDAFSLDSHKNKTAGNEYWKSSELINKFPLEPAIKKDLEEQQPLDEQFQQNSKN